MSHPRSTNLCEALFQSLDEQISRELFPDEDHLAGGLFARLPAPSQIRTHHHVDTLEHRLAIRALHEKHAFIPQHVRTVNLDQPGQEILELGRIKGFGGAKHEGLDAVVVLVVVVFKEIRIDFEDRIEVVRNATMPNDRIGARGFIRRSRALSASCASSDTRSTLESRIRSAKPTCSCASRRSSSCVLPCRASTTVMIASSR